MDILIFSALFAAIGFMGGMLAGRWSYKEDYFNRRLSALIGGSTSSNHPVNPVSASGGSACGGKKTGTLLHVLKV